MGRILKILLTVVLFAAVFVTGFAAGLCVNVFLSRGVPVIHGGGEILMLLAIPAAVYTGYLLGKKKRQKSKKEG